MKNSALSNFARAHPRLSHAGGALLRWLWTFYLPLSILWMEFTLKIWAFGGVGPSAFFFTLLFSVSLGLLGTFFCCLGRHFLGKLFILFLVLATLVVGAQAVYVHIFKTFFVVSSLANAGMVMGDVFAGQAVLGILSAWPALLPILLPLVLWLIFRRRLLPKNRLTGRVRGLFFAGFAAVQFAVTAIVMGSGSGIISPRMIYSESFVPDLSVNSFGALTTLRLDIEGLLLPRRAAAVSGGGPTQSLSPSAAPPPVQTTPPSPVASAAVSPSPTPVVYKPNVLDIDFAALAADESSAALKDMDSYFASVTPTEQNQYTGMFKGKNLIWIVAESFSAFALDPTHTPTLYNLAQKGFVFQNFYNPVWGVSTSDGEYTTLLSLIPKAGVWSMSKSSKDYLPFAFGNQLKGLGYLTLAYHDHTYTYYDRNKSLPNLGYDFYAVGHGLDMTQQWPESDVEMIDKTADSYIGEEPFHVYYMTVSGHMNYTFTGNMMSYKHKDDVADLPYSEGPRAYIAAQMEFDQAVRDLIGRLDAAGELDNTVIAISGDHYPYGLTTSQIEELYGGPIDTDFELYHTTFILWSGDMKSPVEIDKPCCSLDILPTLSNLFGLPFDSRLLMGRDILSASDPLVVFGNHSFLTDKGRYNARTNTFAPAEGADFGSETQDEYAKRIMGQVQSMFTYSAAILDNDYYRKVLG